MHLKVSLVLLKVWELRINYYSEKEREVIKSKLVMWASPPKLKFSACTPLPPPCTSIPAIAALTPEARGVAVS